MMPAPQPVGIGVSREQYCDFLQEKRRRLIALCETAKNYLCLETDRELEELAKPQPQYPQHSFTVEDLTRASKACENIEEQLEALTLVNGSPVADVMLPIIEGMLRPMLRQQLEQAQEFRSRVQDSLEEGPSHD